MNFLRNNMNRMRKSLNMNQSKNNRNNDNVYIIESDLNVKKIVGYSLLMYGGMLVFLS